MYYLKFLHMKSYFLSNLVFPIFKSLVLLAFVLLNAYERNKLSKESTIYVFLGYGPKHKGYRCYDPKSNRLRISRKVTFLEHIPFYALPASHSSLKKPTLYPLDPFLNLFHLMSRHHQLLN